MRKMCHYIVENKRIFVGLEDSKKTWRVCVRSDRIIVHEASMEARYEVLRSYFLNNYPLCDVQVIYEAGFSGFELHDRLESDGFECVVTPPNKVTEAKSNRVKTDKRDARRLAKILEMDDYTACHVPDRERREDRQISRVLTQLMKDINRAKNRIRRFLDFHGLNGDMKAGAWTNADYRKLHDLALTGSLQVSLRSYLKQLEFLWEQHASMKKELRALCDKERYAESVAVKESFPGIGWYTAIRLTLEWGDMARFPSGKHIASYTGLTASECSTGETVRRGRITGQGPFHVRRWLIECAWRSIRKDPALLRTFTRVSKHSGSKKKAIVAVARKLAVRMRAIELAGTTYCPGVIQ